MQAPTTPRAVRPERWHAASWPLGATFTPATGVTTFAVHAPATTRVELEIYQSATGTDAQASFEMARNSDGTWCAAIGTLAPGSIQL